MASAMAEVLRAQEEFDVIHYHLEHRLAAAGRDCANAGAFHDAHQPASR